MVFSGGVWQAGEGEKKAGGGVMEKKMGGDKTGRRRRSHVLLEVQSDLVIH